VTIGLTLPFLTAPDPDVLQEGSLDPLGMTRIATLLADQIAPEVTARMSRVRFVTAMAVGAHVLEEPAEWRSEDGTPAYLAFEWLVVEAFARTPGISDLNAVPGILKARRAYQTRRHVGSGNRYLAIPKVFGFHGVYKRLTIDLGIVDEHLELLPGRGEELVDAWRADQGVRSNGGYHGDLRRLKRQVGEALERGEVVLGPTSSYWRKLSTWFAPGTAGARERRLLRRWLVQPASSASPTSPVDVHRRVRAELAELLEDETDSRDLERELLRRLLTRHGLSGEVRERLEAIDAFEAVSRRLDDAFHLLRVLSSARLPAPVPLTEIAGHPELEAIAAELPALFGDASTRLTELDLGTELEHALGAFRDVASASQLLDALLAHHVAVQGRKEKRPWFETLDEGVLARGPGVSFEAYGARESYVHPYRLSSLRSFCRDLREDS
jgi:hypothetical protein